MEWFNEHVVLPLLATLAAVIAAWYAYDRRLVNERLDSGERRMLGIERRVDTLDREVLLNGREHAVLQVKVDSLRELIDMRMIALQEGVRRIENHIAGIQDK
jgi:hypothetical protein